MLALKRAFPQDSSLTESKPENDLKGSLFRSTLPALERVERELILSNREKELRKGIEYLKEHRLLVVTGMPGIGKSTYARALLEFMPADFRPPFWYRFDRYGTSGNSLSVLLEQISNYLEVYLGTKVRQEVMSFRNSPDRKASASDVDVLMDFLNRDKPAWLVFDNFETVLSRETNQFLDEGIELLFNTLKTSTHNAKIIITNPFVPVLQNGEPYLEDGTAELALEGLDESSELEFLRAYGLTGVPEQFLLPLIREINGHPFFLNYIARHIRALGSMVAIENFRENLEDISSKFGNLLKQRLSEQELNALQSMSVLNREISLPGLSQIARVRSTTVVHLREMGLLQRSESGNFWLHNIVRNSIKPIDADLIHQAHLRAVKFYRTQTQPLTRQKIEDYANVLEWHYHAVKANDVINAYSALYSTGLKEQLMKWNEYELLVQLCEQTLSSVYQVQASDLQVEPNLSNNEKINIYHTLGVADFLLGDFRSSIEHLQAALNLLQEQDDKELRTKLLIDLSESHNGVHDYKSAMDLCDQLAVLLPGLENDALQAKFLHLRGIIHRDSGHTEAAKRDLEDALKLYDQLSDGTHLGNATIDLGNVYYYQNQFEEAVANYQRALSSFESQKDARGIIVARFNIADILLQNEEYQSALDEIQPAVELARKRKFNNLELQTDFIFVEAQLALSRLDEAEQELPRMRELIKKRNSPCFSGQELLLLALSHSKQNQPEQALDCFVRAFELLGNPGCEDEHARGHLLFAAFMKEQGDMKRVRETLNRAKDLFTRLNSQLGLQAAERMLAAISGQ